MQKRQEQLLETIIMQHIKTAQPIGSKLISESRVFDLSPATIRNEMAELENAGYIYQPHTSAGRVPTEVGYQYYVENLLKTASLDKKTQKKLRDTIQAQSSLRDLAKGLAENSRLAVFLGLTEKDYYYTGLSNLFNQPEFYQHELVYNISEVVDHLDEVIYNIFYEFGDEPEILVGSKNPFGKFCSTVLTKFKLKRQQGLLGILGPIRMDYQNNLALIKYSQELIKGM